MSAWNFELFCTAYNERQLPQSDLPEIAIAGRSNVGKSTLINSLLGRTSKKVAHVSSTPGKTRSLNFYRITTTLDKASDRKIVFSLVDLPGFGFASRGKGERDLWGKMIEHYIASSERVLFVMHLIDLRHGPQKKDDELTEWLDEVDMPRLIVFTKCDKVPRSQLKQLYERYVRRPLVSLLPPITTFGKNDEHAEEVRRSVAAAVADLEENV